MQSKHNDLKSYLRSVLYEQFNMKIVLKRNNKIYRLEVANASFFLLHKSIGKTKIENDVRRTRYSFVIQFHDENRQR